MLHQVRGKQPPAHPQYRPAGKLGGQPGEQVGSEPHQEGLLKGRFAVLAGTVPSVAHAETRSQASSIIPSMVLENVFMTLSTEQSPGTPCFEKPSQIKGLQICEGSLKLQGIFRGKILRVQIS